MNIIYTYHNTPYLNLTNRCPCRCVFCLRETQQGVGSAATLWHAKEPAWADIEQALLGFDFSGAGEVVFCGYGEPTCALEHLRRAAAWLREHHPQLKLRLNTNGLGDLIHGRAVAGELAGLIDSVSISLNAPNAGRYHALVRTKWGEAAFDAVLAFARAAKKHIPHVVLSVVDVLTDEEIAQCQAIADELGVPLRVRGVE
ncbi:MAG: TatD family nuclease-associated radical SAM protein [Oscillospiraceae bacterium]|nr:TatD family nuclease-associated radical SAM protein [Oscillospiraceae bacterium]